MIVAPSGSSFRLDNNIILLSIWLREISISISNLWSVPNILHLCGITNINIKAFKIIKPHINVLSSFNINIPRLNLIVSCYCEVANIIFVKATLFWYINTLRYTFGQCDEWWRYVTAFFSTEWTCWGSHINWVYFLTAYWRRVTCAFSIHIILRATIWNKLRMFGLANTYIFSRLC